MNENEIEDQTLLRKRFSGTAVLMISKGTGRVMDALQIMIIHEDFLQN